MLLTHSNLQLEGYYVKNLQCSIEPGLDDSAKLALTSGLHVHPSKAMQGHRLEPNCVLEVGQHLNDPSRFRVALTVKSESVSTGDPLPYRFDLTLVGFFRVAGIKPTTPVESFAVRGAASILYSSARELLASVTGRGPFPALVLPAVTFIDDDGAAPKVKLLPKKIGRTPIKKKSSRTRLARKK